MVLRSSFPIRHMETTTGQLASQRSKREDIPKALSQARAQIVRKIFLPTSSPTGDCPIVLPKSPPGSYTQWRVYSSQPLLPYLSTAL